MVFRVWYYLYSSTLMNGFLHKQTLGSDRRDCFRAFVSFALCEIDYSFLLLFSFLCKLCCAAQGVGNVGHDIVRLFEHPFIAPRYGETWMDCFDALREHGVGVITGIKLVSFWGQTLQNDGITDVRVYWTPDLSEQSAQSHQMLLVGRHKTYLQHDSQSDRSAPRAASV